MSGAFWALVAGVSFGVFQSTNRRANQLVDAYTGTFGLLVTGTVVLTAVAFTTRDASLLRTAPLSSFAYFALAGMIHFFVGWTLLSKSQQRDGANRTGATVGAQPLVATLLAWLFLGEQAPPVMFGGVVLVVTGVAVLSFRNTGGPIGWRGVPWFGIGAAVSWGTSPIFIRWGLEGLSEPLFGVMTGLAGATAAYAVALTVTGRWAVRTMPREALKWIGISGGIVALAIAAQWTAFGSTQIAIAVSLMQTTAPVVILTAPLIVGTKFEPITPPLVIGTVAIMAGSLLVVLTG